MIYKVDCRSYILVEVPLSDLLNAESMDEHLSNTGCIVQGFEPVQGIVKQNEPKYTARVFVPSNRITDFQKGIKSIRK